MKHKEASMTDPAAVTDCVIPSMAHLDFLKNLEKYFQSLSEMLVARAREIPDRPHVLYYDQTVTCSQTKEESHGD